MAMTGVLRIGHVQIRVLNLEESIKFYSNVLGLEETARDNKGRVYFKCWDEHVNRPGNPGGNLVLVTQL